MIVSTVPAVNPAGSEFVKIVDGAEALPKATAQVAAAVDVGEYVMGI